ncbi:MAG: c-type cytochrome [Gammaproteobacteria bacterium]|nr:c-type cytochrome [Gammaproteobacteria bacterium]MDH3468244.1 c-type cytochrome [Gammaproteobacteria bacterium]
MSISEQRHPSRIEALKVLSVAIVAVVALIAKQDAWAAHGARSGQEVVEAVCSACHDTGAQGAPKIGDAAAWIRRASQGLTTLTRHAINGIRDMPAHGGSADVTDLEIQRAVTYMVNQSGGSWTEPIDTRTPTERSAEHIVQKQCAKCHRPGEGGAPKIGDQAAWIPRLKQGFEGLVRSAINGHGGMPSRGGMPDLTDAELRSAILYMFNPAGIPPQAPAAAPATVPDDRHQVIQGVSIYLGIVPVASMRAADRELHGGIPRGKDYYHVNISLQDSETNQQITDAQVELTVHDPITGGQTKDLEITAINESISYGNYFQMTGWDTYSITVHIHRSDGSRAIDANFNLRL